MFAKEPKGVSKRNQARVLPAWLWMLFGSFLTIGIGLFLYLWQPFESVPAPQQTASDEEDTTLTPQVTNAQGEKQYEFYDLLPEQHIQPIPDEAIEPQVAQTTPIENIKPDVVVEIPDDAYGVDMPAQMQPQATAQSTAGNTAVTTTTPAATPTAPVTSTNTDPIEATIKAATQASYILQINSFDNADAADKRRAEVLMAGVDARVVKNTLATGQVLYQVISQPMQTKNAVLNAQKRLQDNGIDSLIVERR